MRTSVRLRLACAAALLAPALLRAQAADAPVAPAAAPAPASPTEPFALPLATIRRIERAPTASARGRVRWIRVPLPADVGFDPSCETPGATLRWPVP